MTTALLRQDLLLCGFDLVAHSEICRCMCCHELDVQADIDATAKTQDGVICFVAWRDQTKGGHDYRTITVRVSSDRGTTNVQARKVLDGRSRADVYVQSYESGVAWVPAQYVRASLEAPAYCANHQPTLTGKDGQTFAVLCPVCCQGIQYLPRLTDPQTVPPAGWCREHAPDGAEVCTQSPGHAGPHKGPTWVWPRQAA